MTQPWFHCSRCGWDSGPVPERDWEFPDRRYHQALEAYRNHWFHQCPNAEEKESQSTVMRQTAPHPTVLAELVDKLVYKPGWQFTLADTDRGQGSQGLTLAILITTPDSYHQDTKRRVMHYMPVPPAAFNAQSWRRWLFDQVLLVESHEACEFFQIDGVRPFPPHHGPGFNPYTIFDHGTDQDARTSYRGDVKDPRA